MKKVLLYATATETLYFHITFYRLTMWFATEGTVKLSLEGIHKMTESKWLILVMKILEKETLFIESHRMNGLVRHTSPEFCRFRCNLNKLSFSVMKILEKETLFIESHWMSGCFLLKKNKFEPKLAKRRERWQPYFCALWHGELFEVWGNQTRV